MPPKRHPKGPSATTPRRYTSCFNYPEGGKPYNEKDRTAWVIEQLLLAALITGIAAVAGLVAGPIGAVIGGFFGSVVGFTTLIENAADSWLNRRLICLSKDNPKCAVGIVSYNPSRSDLGVLDNDQYFDVALMPHPVQLVAVAGQDKDIEKTNPTWLMPKNRYANPDDVKGGYKESLQVRNPVVDGYAMRVAKYPANDILNDDFQGQTLLRPRQDLFDDLGYEPPNLHERVALHCEAEGDFWSRMKDLAPALAVLIDAALVATAAGAAAGSWSGSAAGCALGAWFFGPIGCAIGALIGALLGALAGAAAAAAASFFGAIKPILEKIFEAGPGDVEDANVGDKALGPIRMGEPVAVLGEHVYDGYHTGWHEFHPLMAVRKMPPENYVTWKPSLAAPDYDQTPPTPLPGITPLTHVDMEQGLNSTPFKEHCVYVRDTWCRMLRDVFKDKTRQVQQRLEHRWTVHPTVDGCRPTNSDQPQLH
jgi:hypothetical protein